MREIKFRAYSHRAKKMYQWEDLTNEEIGDMLRNPQEEIMQYTGLKDKNGKEIYGGDIIQSDDYDIGGKNVVEFKNGEFLQKDDKGDYWCISPDIFKTEILGNIYENKDLLIK